MKDEGLLSLTLSSRGGEGTRNVRGNLCQLVNNSQGGFP